MFYNGNLMKTDDDRFKSKTTEPATAYYELISFSDPDSI